MSRSPVLDYLGGIEIIHMRDRTDRYRALARELARIGIAIDDPKVRIPAAPVCDDAGGFPSRGVKGNFLSYLMAVERVTAEDLESILVLEDDAIFRTRLADRAFQQALCGELASRTWDLCFLGHPLSREIARLPRGLVETPIKFKWSHCYLVHRRTAERLAQYLRETIERPVGHPKGGKMYIDGAYSLWRTLYPDVVALVANSALSVQGGTPSGLGGRRCYDRWAPTHRAVQVARAVRDETWRRTGWPSPRAS